MANLTLSIDDKLLQAARVRAVKEGTSVNEVCRKAIENYARSNAGQARLQRYRALVAEMDKHPPEGGPLPAPWKSREEMYARMMGERSAAAASKPARGKR